MQIPARDTGFVVKFVPIVCLKKLKINKKVAKEGLFLKKKEQNGTVMIDA